MTAIRIHHMTRVEGHGDLVAEFREGHLERVHFSVVEAPRFFEAFLRGRSYDEVVHIAPRICGICAVSHKCAALKATEAAFEVNLSGQTELLRRLAFHGEVLGSHILHIYFLAGPDFFRVPSLLHLAEAKLDTVRRAMRLKKLANDLAAVVAGRHIHPVGMTVGGFRFVPREAELAAIGNRLRESFQDLRETVRLFQNLDIPDFERETEYVSLKHPDRYAFYEGQIHSSEGDTVETSRYREVIHEYDVSHSNARYARWNLPEYMTGALARVNNNHRQLSPLARDAANDLGMKTPCHNPFKNTLCQIVECVHCVEDSLDGIGKLLKQGLQTEAEPPPVRPRQGRGVGAVEAPRGTLFHEYGYDIKGKCREANLVIPTAQNLANLEADLRAYAADMEVKGEAELRTALEMMVRAYDPCISCATH